MKWLGWGILAFISIVGILTHPVGAVIDTLPSSDLPIKVNGPLLITGYSFSGHSVNYMQIYNSSPNVIDIAGWKVGYEFSGIKYTLVDLQGMIAPKQYITVAKDTVLPTATFTFSDVSVPSDPVLTSIFLTSPAALNFNDEIISPSITSSTIRVASSPATFYFMRTTSLSTGNYNTTFVPFSPPANFTLASDGLYQAPASSGVTIVEIYPDATTCGPDGTESCTDYVKVFNNSNQVIDLSKFRLRTGSYGQSSTSSNTTELSGLLGANEYISFPITLSSSGSWVWLEDIYGTLRYDSTIIGYPSSSGHDGEAWSFNNKSVHWEWTIYPTPGNAENRFAVPAEINMCEGITINEVAANVASEDQFIEIVNSSDTNVILDGCIIQTNRSVTSSYVLSGELPSGGMQAIYVKDTPLTLTKTTSGTVYLLSSDEQTEVSAIDYENLAENTSWALIDNVWLQTFAITPNAVNIWQEYLPCEDGYFRNLETGYCNKTQVAENLADCGPGKYRSPETSRCKNIEIASSLLTPCAANQVRNVETNRCRSVASESSLQPCAATQERNPDTNRCRNKGKAVMTQADFPVEAVAASSEATIGWWAFGGVGLLAVGYAGWEWRSEVVNIIKKASSFIPNRG